MKVMKIPVVMCISLVMLTLAPKSAANNSTAAELTFESGVSNERITHSSLDSALRQHSLAQITHGLFVISILGLLALKRR